MREKYSKASIKTKSGKLLSIFTSNLPKDNQPISASTNYLDSGTIYEALSYKSNIEHIHTEFNDNVIFNNNIDVKENLTVSGVTFLHHGLMQHLPSSDYNLIYLNDYDYSKPISSYIQSGFINKEIVYIVDDINLPTRHPIFDLRKTLTYNSGIEIFATGFSFFGPKTGAANLPSSTVTLTALWRTGYSNPYFALNTPTIGINEELTRVDWVKQRVRDYSMPNYNAFINISSAWPTSGWTNNLGNGFITIRVQNDSDKPVISLFDQTAHCLIAQFGNIGGKSCYGSPIPVISGHLYTFNYFPDPLHSADAASSNENYCEAFSVFFYPIKY